MGHLHHDHRAGRRHPGNALNARENMNPPAQSGRIELIVGQPRHPIQTTLPVLELDLMPVLRLFGIALNNQFLYQRTN